MKKDDEKRKSQDIIDFTAAQVADELSRDVQTGTNVSHDAMDLLLYKAGRIKNVDFEQGKGNLFEYIENAKLATNMANQGYDIGEHPFVTDAPRDFGGYQEPHSPADFQIEHRNGKTDYAQAKVNNDAHRAAVNFTNPKYAGMQRIAPSDQIQKIKTQLDQMLAKGEISFQAYQDAVQNLQTEGLRDSASGVASGGTTRSELQAFRGKNGKISQAKVRQYAVQFERQQYLQEIGTRTLNGAASGAAMTGIVVGVKNFFEVYRDKKKWQDALKEVGVESGKSAARGGIIGAISSLLRIGGKTQGLKPLTNGTIATTMAGCLFDGGLAIYDYAQGRINEKELSEELVNTVAKGTATVYFSKAIACTVGATNIFIPIAIYTASSYAVMSIRSILKNAKLNAAAHRRTAALYRESAETVRKMRLQMEKEMDFYAAREKKMLQGFLTEFEFDCQDDKNYGRAIMAITSFANQSGLLLQHVDFNEFKTAMKSNEDFVLR